MVEKGTSEGKPPREEATVASPLKKRARNEDAKKNKEATETNRPRKKARKDNKEMRNVNEGGGSDR